MLTAKIGESIVNVFDSKFDKTKLKTYSSKGIIKCPVCEGEYEYCHGEIVMPYFRHKSKECEFHYSEPETEEHMMGKKLLYEWIKEQPDVLNCKLEAWIPETKQRPDIYFEQNGIRYVIEYQCTPISSEHIKRRELYELAGIKDIWILGTLKYNVSLYGRKHIEEYVLSHSEIKFYDPFKNQINYFKSLYLNSEGVVYTAKSGLQVDSLNNFNFIQGKVVAKEVPKQVLTYQKQYLKKKEQQEKREIKKKEKKIAYETSPEIILQKRQDKARKEVLRYNIEKYNKDIPYKSQITIKNQSKKNYIMHLVYNKYPDIIIIVKRDQLFMSINTYALRSKYGIDFVHTYRKGQYRNPFYDFYPIADLSYKEFNVKQILNFITSDKVINEHIDFRKVKKGDN